MCSEAVLRAVEQQQGGVHAAGAADSESGQDAQRLNLGTQTSNDDDDGDDYNYHYRLLCV